MGSKHQRVTFVALPYSWSYMLLRPWEIVGWIVEEVRSFVHRGWYGWAHLDVWGLDNYLFTIIGDAMDELASHKPGCTLDYIEEYGEERAHEQWHKDMLHYAACLRALRDQQYDFTLTSDEQTAMWEQAKTAMRWVADNIYGLWW